MPTNKFLYFFCVMMVGSFVNIFAAAAQQKYTAKDSIEVYKLLDAADEADGKGSMDTALRLVHTAMEKSRQRNFLRGQAFAHLKMADLNLKREGAQNLQEYYDNASYAARQLNDNFLTGLVFLQRAQQKGSVGEYEEAEKYCKQALNHFNLTDSIHYTAKTYNELGYVVEKTGRYEEATAYNLKAIPLFEKAGDTKGAANTSGNQAVVYFKLGKKEEALKMFKESAESRETIGDIKGLAATYGNIATVYLPINDDSAKKYFALQLHNAQKSGVKANMLSNMHKTIRVLKQDR
ncbi:MAG: tetratricopeptide repeat protein [Sphingobacteriales bacterium]|nr:MAG: tetratricopeptide repeat protein [Sphingobacteriales bacterium]